MGRTKSKPGQPNFNLCTTGPQGLCGIQYEIGGGWQSTLGQGVYFLLPCVELQPAFWGFWDPCPAIWLAQAQEAWEKGYGVAEKSGQ